MALEFEQAITGITQPVEAYLAQLNSIQTHKATPLLHKITAPTLVLGGPQDLLFLPIQSEQLHQAIKGMYLELNTLNFSSKYLIFIVSISNHVKRLSFYRKNDIMIAKSQ